MIVWMPRFWRWAFVIFWYVPTPWWKLWRGYEPGILWSDPRITGKRWPTLYAGPLKIVTGPA